MIQQFQPPQKQELSFSMCNVNSWHAQLCKHLKVPFDHQSIISQNTTPVPQYYVIFLLDIFSQQVFLLTNPPIIFKTAKKLTAAN